MNQRSVLIVEDEIITAMEIEISLKKLGCEVKGIVNSGEKAIKRISEKDINLILMDINLEGKLDGIETTEIIRSKINIPIIFLTAHAEREAEIRSRLSFSFGFLSKPFTDNQLKMVISKYTD
jgi:CheY-like chemotaxis protein